MLQLAIRGGAVCRPGQEPVPADIGVQDGVIAAIYPPGTAPAAEQDVDATGKVVLPGFLDAHLHPGVYLPLDEDLRYLTRFAALGGITTIVPFFRPTTGCLETMPSALDTYARNSYLDHQLILGVTRHQHIDELAEVGELYGIWAWVHEFVLVLSPLALFGATESPVRPLAVVSGA